MIGLDLPSAAFLAAIHFSFAIRSRGKRLDRLVDRFLLGYGCRRRERRKLVLERRFLGVEAAGQALDVSVELVGLCLPEAQDLDLLRVGVDRLFLGVDLLEDLSVHDLGDRHAGDLVGHHGGRDQVGDDQDDVLRDLRPGDGLHAAEHRADEDAAEADEDADREVEVEEAAHDDADAGDLRDQVGERRGDRREDADGPGSMAAVAGAEEVRDRELAELPEVRAEEHGEQHVAAGPAHDVGQAVIAEAEDRAGHADERGRGHPVRAGRHAVEERRDRAPGDVVLRDLAPCARDADDGVEADGHAHVDVADHLGRHAEPCLGDARARSRRR